LSAKIFAILTNDVFHSELGGGLLKRDFRDIDPEEGPTTSLAGSILIVQGEVSFALASDRIVLLTGNCVPLNLQEYRGRPGQTIPRRIQPSGSLRSEQDSHLSLSPLL
jgi:hypothetical protein